MIRPGNIDDVGAINEFDPFGGSRESEAADGRIHVFEDPQDGPVAYISTAEYLFHGFPYVTFLVVREDHQRKGIATGLLQDFARLHCGLRLSKPLADASAAIPILPGVTIRSSRLDGA